MNAPTIESRGGNGWVGQVFALPDPAPPYNNSHKIHPALTYIYDDLISRRVHSSDAEKFAQECPCPCSGVGWGVIWGLISFVFLCGAVYLGAVILS
ncbi:hypothetical protein Ahy_A03g014245 [Arachis hypogaea]|uniref:Uncharacterized protein n=1 Tax=Arachis hypogaea TaxID=3818 RepID=A0A445DX87_ARAHY|nr:hypothetical protein Ahy_A03g014245 [Arachis hypogaea]